jgi:peptidoglycan hydrolase-like protein with peptidoglycan-binding domain
MKKQAFKIMFLVGVAFFAFNAEASSNTNYYTGNYNYNQNYSVGACNFSRDLWQGMVGEDVRCLQQYLKDTAGGMNFVYPDGVFGNLTRQAVINWQVNYGISATGVFDSVSRSKYFSLTGGRNIDIVGDGKSEKAINRMIEALQMIQDAENEIDDSNKNTSTAENDLRDAKDDMIDASIAFFVDRDYSEAFNKADDAYDNANDAFEEAGGDSHGDRQDAKDAMNDAQNAIDDAQDEINNAEDHGADVDDANDTLDDAQNKLDDAQDKYDDHNYSKAEDYANDAEDLANDAIDDIDW